MGIEFGRRKEIASLLEARGNGKIKVIEGLRQVGKSYLLNTLYFKELLSLGAKSEEIAILDFLRKDDDIRDEVSLKARVRSLLSERRIAYLFLDEVQLVEGYGDALKTLHAQHPEVDIYVTGSNSKTLSKDIERELGAEDSFEIVLRPLTYAEIRQDLPSFAFSDYFAYGGIPKILLCLGEEDKRKELSSLYRDTYAKDILNRSEDLKSIGEKEKKKILQRVFDTITTGVSLKSIAREINADNKAEHKNSSEVHAEVDTYLERLSESFLFEAMEEDISASKEGSKKTIEDRGKCYCADPGLLRFASHSKDLDSAVYENLVFTHLLSRGYKPISLKFDYYDPLINEPCKNRGIDFCFEKEGIIYLVQAVLNLYGGNAYQREVHNLLFCDKQGKKIVVYSKDYSGDHPDSEGIEFMQIEDFLFEI